MKLWLHATHRVYVILKGQCSTWGEHNIALFPMKSERTKTLEQILFTIKDFAAIFLVYPSSPLGGNIHVELFNDLLWLALKRLYGHLRLVTCVLFSFLQRGLFEGRRPSIEHRRDAFKQREACWCSDHADAERPGSPVPDWVWRLCHGWAHMQEEYVQAL